MDEIDQAIADFEAKKAATGAFCAWGSPFSRPFCAFDFLTRFYRLLLCLAAKKEKKKREAPNKSRETGDATSVVVTSDDEKEKLLMMAPPIKKQKLSKKGHFQAYKAVYGHDVRLAFCLLFAARLLFKS